MKVLNLSLDKLILEPRSQAGRRVGEYGLLADKYWVILPADEETTIDLSEQVRVFGVAGKNKIFQFLKIYFLGRKLLGREKFDVISAQDPYYLGLVGCILSKKFKVGLEVQIHGWEKFYGFRALTAKYVIPRADAVRVVSQRLKKELIEKFNISEGKITVVPIYSDSTLRLRSGQGFKNYDLRIKEEKDRFIFLTVGRLVKVKNIAMQIEAMAEVVKKYPQAELWIVGDGPEEQKLKVKSEKLAPSGAEGLKAENHIKFFGWQNSLDNFYGQADAFLLTSNYEGWGLAVIGAAGFGLPIIMTDVGCAGELIKDGESGIVIAVGDREKLKNAMTELIKNEELRQKLGENAKQSVLKLPSKEETLSLYKKSFEKAAAAGKKS